MIHFILILNSIKSYFSYISGKQGNKTKAFELNRYEVVLGKIIEGDLKFIDMFIKLSIELYSLLERSLNLFLPLVFIGLCGFYINKRFSWNSR